MLIIDVHVFRFLIIEPRFEQCCLDQLFCVRILQLEVVLYDVVVFSEIYYPGWQATIDGQPVDIARADYVLRVMNIPAGEHTIEMWFDPQSIHVTESIAYAALALLLIGVMILVWMSRSRISKKS